VILGKKIDPKRPINEENGKENLDRETRVGFLERELVELNYFLFFYDSILILLCDTEETIVMFQLCNSWGLNVLRTSQGQVSNSK